MKESGFRNVENLGLKNPDSGKILLVESGILGFGTQNTVQGIRNPTEEWNPESKFHSKRLEYGIYGMEFIIQDGLEFPYTGRIGSFTVDDGNCSKNVSFKMNSRFFNLCPVYSNLLKMASVGEFPWS